MTPEIHERTLPVNKVAAFAVPVIVLLLALLAAILCQMRRKRSPNYNAVPLDPSAAIKRWSKGSFTSQAPQPGSTTILQDIGPVPTEQETGAVERGENDIRPSVLQASGPSTAANAPPPKPMRAPAVKERERNVAKFWPRDLYLERALRPSAFVSNRLRTKVSIERRIRSWLGQNNALVEVDADARTGERETVTSLLNGSSTAENDRRTPVPSSDRKL